MKKQNKFKLRAGTEENIQKCFTLIEVLMATSIFTAIGLMAITIFININNLQLRSSMENALYEDARFMMERLTREVRNNAIDYEEYFNKELGSCKQYGDSYGFYAAQFYNPGAMRSGQIPSTATPAPNGDYGAFCNNGDPYTGQNCTVYKPSVDNNTGQFPIPGLSGLTAQQANSDAFCPAYFSYSLCADPSAMGNNFKDQLYLISPDGKTKTIFARKQVNNIPEYALAELSLSGEDSNNDGITEKWRECGSSKYCCSAGFYCPDTLNSLESSLNIGVGVGLYDGFVPISPIRSTISNLNFIISPNEDPHKAFAENNLEQPSVAIIMTVTPSASELSKFPSGAAVPSITLESLVTSRVQTEVKSYLGYDTQNIGYADTGYTGACP